jgi:hypothetical protein
MFVHECKQLTLVHYFQCHFGIIGNIYHHFKWAIGLRGFTGMYFLLIQIEICKPLELSLGPLFQTKVQ